MSAPPPVAAIAPPAVFPAPSDETEVVTVKPMHVEPIARPPATPLALVFSAGGDSYMQLEAETLPPHGNPQLHDDAGMYSSVAAVELANVPREARAWLNQRVIVDGKCNATVVGFAVIGRLTGNPGYAGLEGNEVEWTATNVMEHGSPVLAARLSGCTGTYARAAELPAIVRLDMIELEKHELVGEARALLLRSDASIAAQREWASYEQTGKWHASEDVRFSTAAYLHPTTRELWISVHGYLGGGCGEPSANVWGLYRIDNGSLTAVEERELGALHSIDQVIDIEGDGALELVGRDWFELTTIVTRADGDELASLGAQFYGCGC